MPIRAAIFDRDGVLTYFDVAAATAFFQPLLPLNVYELGQRWEVWGAKVGFPRNPAQEEEFWRGYWNAIGDEVDATPIVRQQLQAFSYTSVVRPFPDARSALQTVRQHGLRTAVLTNFSVASLDQSLLAADLADLVDVACAASVIGASKPDPNAYLHVTRALDVAPEECLFFDDEPACVAGARTVGMQAYLVNRRQLTDANGQDVVGDLTDITRYVLP